MSSNLASIIIPIANYHRENAERAIASAYGQTMPCDVIIIEDKDSRGAGWARNQGARQATTPFLIFLDADDEIDPHFVQHTAWVYRPGVFVYTDWRYHTGELRELPNCTDDFPKHGGWKTGQMFHVITTLLPTAYYHQVGGFDESLPAMEDTDFYLKLREWGVCGIRLDSALFTYNAESGLRSTFGGLPYEDVLKRRAIIRAGFRKKYRRPNNMGCCGGGAPAPNRKPDVLQDGDVWAKWTRKDKPTVVGPISGRPYKMGSRLISVDPRDIEHIKDLVQVVRPEDIAPKVADVRAKLREVFGE